MLEGTEIEETRLLCHIFIIGGFSIGGPGLPTPPGYAYDTTRPNAVIIIRNRV